MKMKTIILPTSCSLLSLYGQAAEKTSDTPERNKGVSGLLKQFEGGQQAPIPPANSSPTAPKRASPSLLKTAPTAVKHASPPQVKRSSNAAKQTPSSIVTKASAPKNVPLNRGSNHAAPVPANPVVAQPPAPQHQNRQMEPLKCKEESGKKPGLGPVQEQRANFALREAMIDECVKQCALLKSPELTYGQLTTACLTLYPLYDNRQAHNKAKSLEDKACEKICTTWYFSEEGRQKNQSDDKMNRNRHKQIDVTFGTDGDHWYDLVRGIKEDITESMEIYEKFHGEPHPLKDEFLSLCAPAQTVVAIPRDTPEIVSPASPPLSATAQQRMNAVRQEMLDESIEQFKLWTKKSFTHGKSIETFKILTPHYNKIIDILPWENISSYEVPKLSGPKYIFYTMESLIRVTPDFSYKMEVLDHERTNETGKFFRLRKEIRDDILVSLDLYEKLNGKPHPRKEEFLELEKKAYPKL
ncbi:MAG: hypothetical protein FJX03_00525 [Alphaproteobacteria bacterium]|nr:hypothetical protein [Alphaproteobacteria bacterium]